MIIVETAHGASCTMNLKSMSEYSLGNTPMYKASKFCASGNLYLKLENYNPNGSVKDRAAYFIIKDLIDTGQLKSGMALVESSSGNLGLALGYFCRALDLRFLCLVDPTIAPRKLEELEGAGVEARIVLLGQHADYRSARIHEAQTLNQQQGWIWTNQYDNPANFRAHYDTTGPEIWSQTEGQIDYVVCSVGTGGTICGIGHYLKQKNPAIKIVAVEPEGSTIFGGKAGKYLTAGAGMPYPSGIFRRYGQIVDYYSKVDDRDALAQCFSLLKTDNLSVGITAGSALVIASYLAKHHPMMNIVSIVSDGGERYSDIFATFMPSESESRTKDIKIIEYRLGKSA